MTDQKDRLTFTGDGFSKDEMTPEERARQRERNHHYDRHFLTPDAFLKETGLKWLADVAKGVPAFLKAFAGVGTLAGGYAAAKALGWL